MWPATLALADRKGVASPLIKEPGDYDKFRFSPDGERLALRLGVPGDVWIYDLARGTMTRLTFGLTGLTLPFWTPDGRRVTYSHPDAKGVFQLYSKRADGVGQEEQLTESRVHQLTGSWSPDGKVLAFQGVSPDTHGCCEIWTLRSSRMDSRASRNCFSTPRSSTAFPSSPRTGAGWPTRQMSPERFRFTCDRIRGKWQVSTDGGAVPRWSKAGHELFYLNGDKVIVVPYTAKGDAFEPGTPRLLFQGQFAGPGRLRLYDVAPDGKHFVMFQAANEKQGPAPQPVLVLHWFDQVRRLVQGPAHDRDGLGERVGAVTVQEILEEARKGTSRSVGL